MFKMVLYLSKTWWIAVLHFSLDSPMLQCVNEDKLTFCTAHLHYIYIKQLSLWLFELDFFFRPVSLTQPTTCSVTTYTFTWVLPYTLTFSNHVECNYKRWWDIAALLSGWVREVTSLHALFNRDGQRCGQQVRTRWRKTWHSVRFGSVPAVAPLWPV